jgi:WD40 repeat protein
MPIYCYAMTEAYSDIAVRTARSVDRNGVDHKTFLLTTDIGELELKRHSTFGSTPEQWRVEAEWTVLPGSLPTRWRAWFTGSGYKEEHFRPSFVMWKPDGDTLYTAPDHNSVVPWDVRSRAAYREPCSRPSGVMLREYWSDDARWFLAYCEPRYSSERCGVFTSWGENCGWLANGVARFGMVGRDRGPSPAFNPWRPFSERFVTREYPERFQLFRIGTDEKGRDRPEIEDVIDLAPLDPDDKEIDSFLWHPSGRYLSYSSKLLNRSTWHTVTRMHLLDWTTGRIVLSSEPVVARVAQDLRPICYAWSPGGAWLVLDDGVTHIWDVQRNAISQLPSEAASSTWVRKLRAVQYPTDRYGRGFALTSPDGLRRLHQTGDRFVVESDRPGPRFSVSACAAAWHPTDPDCFATVGGERKELMVRIWRVE